MHLHLRLFVYLNDDCIALCLVTFVVCMVFSGMLRLYYAMLPRVNLLLQQRDAKIPLINSTERCDYSFCCPTTTYSFDSRVGLQARA